MIGSVTASLFTDTKSFLYENLPDLNTVEKAIFVGLVKETPSSLQSPIPNFIANSEDLNDSFKRHVMIQNSLSNSNVIMTTQFNKDTPVVTPKNNFSLYQHNAGNAITNQLTNVDLNLVALGTTNVSIPKTTSVGLGDDTAPLYRGCLKFEFTNGDFEYNSTANGHYISFDTSNPDCNLHLAVNSPLSNLQADATNGLRGGFDNLFNQNDAFYSENILVRGSSDNKVSLSGSNLGYDGISKSNGVPDSPAYNALNVSVLDSSSPNHPLFGSLKFVQDPLSIVMNPSSNVYGVNSTMSRLDATTVVNNTQQSAQTSDLYSTMDETHFESLFTPSQLPKVGPGYTFKMDIGNSSLGHPMGGYDINTPSNFDIVPVYDSNNVRANGPSVTMFDLDDSDIDENFRYMSEMKYHDLFGNHKFYMKNGTLELDPSQSSNKNYHRFLVMDGLESLKVMSSNGINDLTQSGNIKVSDTKNILGDPYSRYQKLSASTLSNSAVTSANLNVSSAPSEPPSTSSTLAPIRRLIVSYDSAETEYLPDVGTLSLKLQDTPFIDSECTVLTKSTMTGHDLWTTGFDVKQADDSCLVFQSLPESGSYSKSNVLEYIADGLNSFVPQDKFALLTCKNLMNFVDSNESPMFRTASGNNSFAGLTTNVSASSIDLNDPSMSAQDLRAVITCKTKLDMPSLTPSATNVNPWQWNIGNTTNGDLVTNGTGNSTVIVDQNNGFVISEKTGTQYLGTAIYNMMKADPTANLSVSFKIMTNSSSVISKDILERRATVTMALTNVVSSRTIDVELDDNDFEVIMKSETTSSPTIENLSDKILADNRGIPSHYEVRKYVVTSEYIACIRNKIGPYSNLWCSTPVKEVTIFYELYNKIKNCTMPDYYLYQITNKNSSNLSTGVQSFMASRKFVTNTNTQVSTLTCTSNFKVKDLMGFRVGFQYQQGSTWKNFPLKPDSDYDYGFDPMFDRPTTLNLIKPGTSNIDFGVVEIAVDTPQFTKLGVSSHMTTSNNPDKIMYMINLSHSVGSNSFEVKGYMYSISSDSQYFNKNVAWSPYAVGDNLFLKDSYGVFVGQPIPSLNTLVSLIDPTPTNTTNVNEVNRVKLEAFSGATKLFEFTSSKYVLENFNVILTREPIIQHEYKTGPLDIRPSFTEYLQSKPHSSVTPGTSYVKLLYGEDLSGVRCEFNYNALRGNRASFKLLSDYVSMSPLVNNVDSVNGYSGRYALGERILSSATGKPLPTNSSIHRNLVPKHFRGFINGEPDINVKRTMTTIKMVMGNKFQDRMNTHSQTNIGSVWKNRGVEGFFDKLEANDMRQVTVGGPQPDNLDITMGDGSPSIGTLGLKIVPKFSMFSREISSVKHVIPINITPAHYKKDILNPLDATVNETVNSNVFDVVLHSFLTYAIVATRVKTYNTETYGFTYNIPDLNIYHSPDYVGNPSTMTNWTQIQTYSDSVLRSGVVVGDSNFAGVVKFDRSLTHVSGFTKYCTLPRPIGYLESYNATILSNPPGVTLPANLSSYVREKYYFDINITDSTNVQGQLPSLQQNNLPFNKHPNVGVPNAVNAVPSNKGLNNVKLGLKLDKYLETKYNSLSDFDFTLSSNKVKIYNGIGLSGNPHAVFNKIYEGYISHLDMSTNWISELAPTINNVFTSGKKWNINTRQLLGVLQNYLSLSPSSLLENYLYINGITSFGLGTYYLDLHTGDSTFVRYYSTEYNYNTSTKQANVIFTRYTTAEIGGWDTDDMASNLHVFCPIVTAKELCNFSFSLGNLLPNEPLDIPQKLRDTVNNLYQSGNLGNIVWVFDNNFQPTQSPIRLVPLSQRGAGALADVLQVIAEKPYRILASKRDDMLTINSADGAPVFKINHDGHVFTPNVTTYQMLLLPAVQSQHGIVDDYSHELFMGNIYGSNYF